MYGYSLPGYSPWVWVLVDFNTHLRLSCEAVESQPPWSTIWVALNQDRKKVGCLATAWFEIDRFSLVVDRDWTPHVFIPRFGCFLVGTERWGHGITFRDSLDRWSPNKFASLSTGATLVERTSEASKTHQAHVGCPAGCILQSFAAKNLHPPSWLHLIVIIHHYQRTINGSLLLSP